MKGQTMPKESIKHSAVTALSAFIGVVAAIWGLSVSVGDRLWVTKAEFTPVKEDIAAIKAVMSIRCDVTARRRTASRAANVDSNVEGE